MRDDVTRYPPPPPRRIAPPRQRGRDFTWWDDREHAETVQCPRPPKGCGAPIGTTCRNRAGVELQNMPAHTSRSDRATATEPDPTRAGYQPVLDSTEETAR